MTELFSIDEKKILLQIIEQSRFTPNEWEVSVKPIVVKLQSSIGEK